MKLEINHRRGNEKKPNTWRLKNMLLKKKCVNEEIKKEIKNPSRRMIMKTQPLKIYGMPQKQCSEGSS